MKAIRRSHVEAWVKAMSTQWAPSTIKTRFVIVRSVFRAAVADRVIGTDPSIGVALPRRRKAEAAMRIPSVEEVGQLLVHADSSRVSTRKGFTAYVALCAFAGLRKGEAAAVQVGDIDFLRRQLAVSRQLQRDGNGYAVRPPKYGSERVVYLPDELVTILSEHVATHLDDADPTRWLFTVDDEPMYDNAITWRWRATRTAAKLAARPAPRPPALLRLRPDRRRLRCRHRPASPRALDRHDDAGHLQPPVADCRGPHPQGRQRSDAPGASCGVKPCQSLRGPEVELDPVRGPRRHSRTEEVLVLGPDRAVDGQRGGEDRPVVRISELDPRQRIRPMGLVDVVRDRVNRAA